MTRIKLVAVASAAIVCVTAAFAQSAAGIWRGSVQMPAPTLPPNMPQAQRDHVKEVLDQYKKMVLVLKLNSDKTYKITASGGPKNENRRPMSGTWSQNGLTLSISYPKNPRGGTPPSPMMATLAKDGNTISLIDESGAHIVFGRT